MTDQPHILVVGNDPTLAEEFEAAVAALRGYRPLLRFVQNFRQAVEAARSWRPQAALVDMSSDLAPLKRLASEIHASAPETSVVGVYRPEILSYEAQESSLLIEAVRSGVQDFLRRPVSSADLSALLDRLLTPTTRREQMSLAKIVSFVSNKGGVGKSTLAVNVACGLSQRYPEQVLLIDSSLQMGTCASLLDLRPTTTLTDVARQHGRLDETLIRQLAVPHHSGLHLLAAPSSAMEGTEVTDEVLSRLLTLARRSYRFVIVDTFPIIDSVVVATVDLSDLVYIVLENVVPTLLGATKLVDALNGLGLSPAKQHVVVNRFQRISGNPTAADVAARLGRPVEHVVPYDRRVVIAGNMGEPFYARAGRYNAARRALTRIMAQIDRLDVTPPPAMLGNGQPAPSPRPVSESTQP